MPNVMKSPNRFFRAINVFLILATIFLIPIFGAVNEVIALAWFCFVLLISGSIVMMDGAKVFSSGLSNVQWMYLGKFALLGMLAAVHFSDSLTNLGGMAIVDLSMLFLTMSCAATAAVDQKVLRLICITMLGSVVVYIPIAIVMSKVLPVADPILSVLMRHRLILLSPPLAGHSVLLTYSAVAMLLIVSDTIRVGIAKWPLAVLSALLLAISGSSTGILVIAVIGGIFGVSRVLKKPTTALAVMLVVFIAVASLGNTALEFVRNLQGVNTSDYHGDLTAGRALLNRLMWDSAWQAPLTGLGTSNDVIQYGIGVMMDTNDQYMATVESPVRLAAKFGFPFWIWTSCIAFSPVILVFFSGQRLRGGPLAAVMFTGALGVFAFSNCLFEASTQYDYWIETFFILFFGYSISSETQALKAVGSPVVSIQRLIPRLARRSA